MSGIFFKEEFEILITCGFGLESVLKKELFELGYDDFSVENGRVSFTGTINDVFITNLYIRTGDRVYIRLKKFQIENKQKAFDELFDGVYEIKLQNILPVSANFIVNAKSIKSQLSSVRTIQSVCEKAIVNKLKRHYDMAPNERFLKNGSKYEFEVNLLKDEVEVLLDTSGVGLHKRGYRSAQGEAPIKETLAAAMVMLSGWDGQRTLVDPFCGSGTILIEAAMIANNIPPGINRDFACLHWAGVNTAEFERFKTNAKAAVEEKELKLLGADIDENVLKIAYKNAQNAGIDAKNITFIKKDFKEFDFVDKDEVIITNPPYGKRLEDMKSVQKMYGLLGKKLKQNPEISLFLITMDEEFEKSYGKKASKKRKLYNGKIKVFYYQYF